MALYFAVLTRTELLERNGPQDSLEMVEQPNQRVCLFNCDNTYKLNVVERFLMVVKEKYGFQISVEKFDFRLNQMAEISETTIPQLQMDIAIFVVHAHESRLSINEDNAGIGYAKVYKALLQAAGEYSGSIRKRLISLVSSIEILLFIRI